MSDHEGYDPLVVRQLYDGMAADYAVRFGSELADAEPGDPDIEFLDSAAGSFPDGPVVDLGCGPAQVSRFLTERGRSVLGIDFAIGMLTEAARLNSRGATGGRPPGLAAAAASFVAADLLELPLRAGSCAAVVASYSLHHLPKARLAGALAGFREVLRPGGVIVVITHSGSAQERLDKPEGQVVVSRYEPDELAGRLRTAGFTPELIQTRPPRPGEYPAEKIRITARR